MRVVEYRVNNCLSWSYYKSLTPRGMFIWTILTIRRRRHIVSNIAEIVSFSALNFARTASNPSTKQDLLLRPHTFFQDTVERNAINLHCYSWRMGPVRTRSMSVYSWRHRLRGPVRRSIGRRSDQSTRTTASSSPCHTAPSNQPRQAGRKDLTTSSHKAVRYRFCFEPHWHGI